MQPSLRTESLWRIVSEAVIMAEQGQPDQGYDFLLQGLRRAEQARQGGEEWAGRMVRDYRLALARYANRYGVFPR